MLFLLALSSRMVHFPLTYMENVVRPPPDDDVLLIDLWRIPYQREMAARRKRKAQINYRRRKLLKELWELDNPELAAEEKRKKEKEMKKRAKKRKKEKRKQKREERRKAKAEAAAGL